jgi:putative copper export protein
MLLVIGIPAALRLEEAARGRAVADFVNAFSPTALVFAGLAASTGVFAAWLHLGTIPALWQTAYGQTLLVKLGILSVVAGTGAYNWLRVKPSLGDIEGAVRIRRSATVELAVGVLVLAVTAVLVAKPTAMDVAAMTSTAAKSSARPTSELAR